MLSECPRVFSVFDQHHLEILYLHLQESLKNWLVAYLNGIYTHVSELKDPLRYPGATQVRLLVLGPALQHFLR